MQRDMNKNVNRTTETWITTGTPYFTETDSKFVRLADASTFPIAVTETMEFTQTITSVTLNSPSEDVVKVVRRHPVSTETTGSLACRDFKPELIALANAATMVETTDTPATGTYTVKNLGDWVIFDGVQKDNDTFVLKNGADEYDQGVHYVLSKGVFEISATQPVDGIAVGDVLTYEYIKKASKKFQAGKKTIYGIITFIGYRHTETENNLYKVTARVQIDPAPFIGQSAEDFASATFTFTVLQDPNANTEDGIYTIELATDD